MIHKIRYISKEAALFALDVTLAQDSYKIMCYVDSMEKPEERDDAAAYSIVKINGQHEYVRMDYYEWRSATPDEEIADIALAKSLINQCDQFEIKSSYYDNSVFLLIAYNSAIHKTVNDYALHIEHISKNEMDEILAIDEREALLKSIASIEDTPKQSKRMRL